MKKAHGSGLVVGRDCGHQIQSPIGRQVGLAAEAETVVLLLASVVVVGISAVYR